MKKFCLFLVVGLLFCSCSSNVDEKLTQKVRADFKRFSYSIGQDTSKVFIDSVKIIRSIDDLFKLTAADTSTDSQKEGLRTLIEVLKDSVIFMADLFVEVEPNLFEVYKLHSITVKEPDLIFPNEKEKPYIDRIYRSNEYRGRNQALSDSVFYQVYAAENILKNRMKYPDSFEVVSSKKHDSKPWWLFLDSNIDEKDYNFYEVEAISMNGFGGKTRSRYVLYIKKEYSSYLLFMDYFWEIEEKE